MFTTAWYICLQWVRDRVWALREARKTYRDALSYCAVCQEQAEAHYDAAASRPALHR